MDTLGLFLPMVLLSAKTKEALQEKAQDSFTLEEVVEAMAHAVSECICEIKERESELEAKKREELPNNKEQSNE